MLIVLDHFSKFHFLEPIRTFTARKIVEYLEKRIFAIFGVPELITTDNGVQFRSSLFKDLIKKYGMTHNLIANYSLQANAAVRAYIHPDQKDWDEALFSISAALRSSVHSSAGFSPYFIVFGQNMMFHATGYELLRKLKLLEDPSAEIKPDERTELIREQVRQNLRKAFEINK